MSRKAVQWESARDLLYIAHEAATFRRGTTAGRNFLLGRVMHLLGADLGLFAVDPGFSEGGCGQFAHITVTGRADETPSLLDALVQYGRGSHPVLAALSASPRASDPAGCRTVRRLDVVSDDHWYSAAYVLEHVQPAGLDDWLVSLGRPGPLGVTSWLAMVKKLGEAPFTEEERDLLSLAHETCEGILAPELPSSPEESLSPRMHEALHWLLTGAADKQVAHELGVSFHTAREYTKKILRTFGVTSRSELLAQLGPKRLVCAVPRLDPSREPGSCEPVAPHRRLPVTRIAKLARSSHPSLAVARGA